jgi:hypothetical protein
MQSNIKLIVYHNPLWGLYDYDDDIIYLQCLQNIKDLISHLDRVHNTKNNCCPIPMKKEPYEDDKPIPHKGITF